MNISDITPMILTYNEEANLRSTLSGLKWASEILIIDSFSTDQTLAIAADFPQARVVQRKFDHQTHQCNFGLQHISTTWVLSLDADYKCDKAFEKALKEQNANLSGYQVKFQYGIFGKRLRAALYPPRTVLYRRDAASYVFDGHTQRVRISGDVGDLPVPILHDDWKPLSVWLQSQSRYAVLEADKIMTQAPIHLKWKDRLRRKIVFAPALTFLYCFFAKRLLLDGWHGLFYSLQRTYAELLLSLTILDRRLRTQSTEPENETQTSGTNR